MTEDRVTALLPIHAEVELEHLRLAVDSVLAQDLLPFELVVVEDGPLPQAHRGLLDGLEARHRRVVRVRLPINNGPGVANQAGLQVATGRWIAKVDADDVSMPERFRVQMDHLTRTGADVCGTAMLEFEHDPAVPTSLRRPPSTHRLIVRRMRTNNPICHPTSIYRRDLAIACGGYPDLRFGEDYVLFARMWRDGAKFTNVAEPLLRFRADAGMHARRGLRDQAGVEWRLQEELMACGLIRPWRRWWNLCVRLGYRSLPIPIRRSIHRRVLGRAGKPARGGR